MRRLLRPICRLVGHGERFSMLPEFFGLYRYSRRFCPRCDLTFESHPPTDAEITAYWLAETEAVSRVPMKVRI